MDIMLPELSLVVLIGSSGSGKSTFAKRHFLPTEVISSDVCRGLVSDDENSQAATDDAFDVLDYIAAKRLAAGKLTVIDATNVQPKARKSLVELARRYHCLLVAIVFDLPERVCLERNASRPDRSFGSHVVLRQKSQLQRSLRDLKYEGFRYVYVLKTQEDVDAAVIDRQPLWNNKKHEHGPLDIIGDVHGCIDELEELLSQLGYAVSKNGDGAYGYSVNHPEDRKVVFVGDLVDRGPNSPQVLKLVMSMVASGSAYCVPGNHDAKLLKALNGRNVQLKNGLAETMEQLAKESPEFREQVKLFIDGLISHYLFDDGKLVVAHAGMKQEMQGRGSAKVRDFALYGETTGETDEYGFPVRIQWAADYRGDAMVVYGHTPIIKPDWINRTVDIDTGCVFGGALTALRYPEREMVSVAAHEQYYEPVRPLAASAVSTTSRPDDVLDIDDVLGKRIITTRMQPTVYIQEENARTALEVMSRFAANPRWLIYLPPTMSPPETSSMPGYLEHPTEAFTYYSSRGVLKVVCEQKHMGSRAVVVICRDEAVAETRFGVRDEGYGICYTRTGRRFFDDTTMESQFLERVRKALDQTDFWGQYNTDWACFDCELMPWSAKAQELIQRQYAAVGASARVSMKAANEALIAAASRGVDLGDLPAQYAEREVMASRFVDAYRQYCWKVNSIDDLKLAPFHLLATEGCVYTDRDHVWHMDTLAKLCQTDDPLLMATPYQVIDAADENNAAKGIAWWEELTANGGEGMVVKPYEFISYANTRLLQPAVKCRGREYLRIIYGPEYSTEPNLQRLRRRSLGAKRKLAISEFVLGVEALERFVRHDPLYSVHECVFGVLALESEPVDPRL